MVDMTVKIEGLDQALRNIREAFPDEPKEQRKLLTASMSGAARKTFIPMAKSLALQGDGSGALSESIKPRAVSLARARLKGAAAAVEITPVRSDRRAIAKYIAYYYASRGRSAPASLASNGLRYGHLVEFGFKHKRGGVEIAGRPFLWPAAAAQKTAYVNEFAKSVKSKIAARLRLRARKKAKKG